MRILKRLFTGESSTRELEMYPGVVAEISRADVVAQGTHTLRSVLDGLASYPASHDRRFYVELVFAGFDTDPRPGGARSV